MIIQTSEGYENRYSDYDLALLIQIEACEVYGIYITKLTRAELWAIKLP